MAETSDIVGGGPKKVLYTLSTISKIGVGKAAKALTAKNTCKACAYGMGGQHGGMTNELDEFPSVCNKSVQAQSTDIQPAIPEPVFQHTIAELAELSGREMERLGRLGTPLFRRAGSDRFEPLDWETALDHAAHRLVETDPQRTFFYSSGRSSNEAGFLFQLLARAYGTNNVNNCSYYCHQATSEGLATTIGKGTATVELEDLTGADLIFVIGANPSSNHPRFIHMLKNCRERGGQVIVINPAKEPGLVKFSVPKSPLSMLKGGSEIASDYLQPRIGSDIALLKGLVKAVLEQGTEDADFIARHGADFEAFRRDIAALSWDEVVAATGIAQSDIERVAAAYGRSKAAVFAWGMGMTHHVHGTANVEAIANLALVRGMIGKRFAGLLPLRGHSNVQGIGTIGVKPVLARDVLKRMEEVFGVSFPEEKGLDTMACLKRAEAGEVDAAVIMGGNLWAATPDTGFSTRAMGAIGFKLFLTTTLNQGHVHGLGEGEVMILPVTARDEEWEPTTQESMFNFVRLSDGGIERIGTVRPESWILGQLGKRMLPGSPIDFYAFSGHAKLRDAIAAIVPGMEELADIDVAKREFHIRHRVLHVPEFGTVDGKAHFVVTPIPRLEAGKLMLASVRSEGQFNSIIYEETDSYRGKAGRYAVFLSADDMHARGLSEGQRVRVRSSVGEMEGVATCFDLPAGSVLAYYPEANVLIGTEVDPRSKTPAFKSVPVSVVAA
ncbi:FdhF/YdeP family oxidoreductase [Devosia sp. BK]|uniref:FdhF/YdeP family oxidoreductase n=1 Tax=Devosia sp. BK TaxID=2871706 RepID=UPI0029396D56|nr:FdhF/YdeP family oxidoreductase [Devosia sp. BK]MDV3250314.1 FdhF/YdeP family oxidoreductase [Devosia sp. BK]